MSWKALAIGFVAHSHLTRSPCMTTQVKSKQYGVSDLYYNKRYRRPRKYQYYDLSRLSRFIRVSSHVMSSDLLRG
jgi:hypothetical protein